jgi:hypothetical protein
VRGPLGTSFAFDIPKIVNSRRGAGSPRNYAFKELNMDMISQAPILFAAIQYSLIYLLLGGGMFGAIVIYIVAKLLGK